MGHFCPETLLSGETPVFPEKCAKNRHFCGFLYPKRCVLIGMRFVLYDSVRLAERKNKGGELWLIVSPL
jgi:hypothetical protein